jgi:hypothetical protein
MDINSLKQYMDFYKSIMPQTPNYGPSSFGGGESAMNQANDQGRALSFALRMGGPQNSMPQMQQPPDFFSKFSQDPAQGAQVGDNPYSARVQTLQGQPFAQQPERGQVMNYLSRLLK